MPTCSLQREGGTHTQLLVQTSLTSDLMPRDLTTESETKITTATLEEVISFEKLLLGRQHCLDLCCCDTPNQEPQASDILEPKNHTFAVLAWENITSHKSNFKCHNPQNHPPRMPYKSNDGIDIWKTNSHRTLHTPKIK